MKRTKDFTNKKIKPIPNFDSGLIQEPLLVFGGGHTHVDPKIGLGLYGPYTNPEMKTPALKSITVGIVGPGAMIADASHWLEACKGMLTNDGSQPFLYPYFPGFNADQPFQCELVHGETWNESIKEGDLRHALAEADFFTRIDKIIDLYVDVVKIISQREPKPNVILCCIPETVIELCTVRTEKTGETKRIKLSDQEKQLEKAREKLKKTKQLTFLFDDLNQLPEEEEPFVHQNLRRGLKAETMIFGIPTQIVWPRTLTLTNINTTKKEKRAQDISTRAWNFISALYYKAGGSPWRLYQLDPGVCFIGISFYKDIHQANTRMKTCMAQTFTSAGDGFVLRGNSFEWDESENGKSPHLDNSSAFSLIQNVLELYKSQNRGQLPSRLVIHKTSKFWDDELQGFERASEIVPRKDFVAFGRRGIQFYRPGEYPPLRGTYVKFSDENFLLYTIGYTPFLRSYNGPRVPQPLEIIQHLGDTPWNIILKEIMALTKMNWNTADFSCAAPITIAFSQKVGQILAEPPDDYPIRPEYRFYM